MRRRPPSILMMLVYRLFGRLSTLYNSLHLIYNAAQSFGRDAIEEQLWTIDLPYNIYIA